MNWFELALVLHLVGVLMLVAAIAGQLMGILILRSAQSVDQIRCGLATCRRLPPVFHWGSSLIVFPGLYMMLILHVYTWTLLALTVLVAMAISGAIITKKNVRALAAAIEQSGGTMTDPIRELAQCRLMLTDAINGLCLIVALVVIMVAKPDVFSAMAMLVVGLIVGVGTAGAIVGRADRHAASASTQPLPRR